ncbi:hypothetical protein [uncultured Arsenicicoccus sp.]|uniref:hypothetical protein n=1 Tax=uncultured Arsenicicoccus sp. TaxID=491339 RepID=UPI002591DBF2|nr:hypothetical protein [uncultured Arsenicicoccus sp.]
MTVSKTPRLALTTWDSDSDPFERADQHSNNLILDGLVSIDRQGTADLLSAETIVRGATYYATDTGVLYRCDGQSWLAVGATKPATATGTTTASGWTTTAGVPILQAWWRSGVCRVVGAVTTTSATPAAKAIPLPASVPPVPAAPAVVATYGRALVVSPSASTMPSVRTYIQDGYVYLQQVGGAALASGQTITYDITYVY